MLDFDAHEPAKGRRRNPAALTPNIIVQRAPETAALLRDLADWFGAFRIDPPIDHGSVNRAVAFVEMRSEFFVQVIKPSASSRNNGKNISQNS
ncbi:MAG: hypothetical protein WCE36_17300 [Pseudolabrys sp.]